MALLGACAGEVGKRKREKEGEILKGRREGCERT
jgi:hypothetical protein